MAKKNKKKPKEIELVNEEIIRLIYNSDKSIWKIAKESNRSVEEFQELINAYHQSIEGKMEFDKKERKKLKELFLEIEEGLEKLRSEIPNIHSNMPIKNYCGDFKPLKRQGNFSFVSQIKKDEMI